MADLPFTLQSNEPDDFALSLRVYLMRKSFATPASDFICNEKIIEEKTVTQLDGPYHLVWPEFPVIHEETFDFVAAREMGIVTEEEEKRLKSNSIGGNYFSFDVTAMLRRLPIEVGTLILQFVLQNKSLYDAIVNFKVVQLCSNFRKYRNFKGFEKVWNSFLKLRENRQMLYHVVIYSTPSWEMYHYRDDKKLFEKVEEEMESRLKEEETGHSIYCVVAYSLVNWMTVGREEVEWEKREGCVYWKQLFEEEPKIKMVHVDEFDEPEEDEDSMGSDWRESEEEEESTEGSTTSSEHESEGSIKSAKDEEEEEEEEKEDRSTEFTEEKNVAS